MSEIKTPAPELSPPAAAHRRGHLPLDWWAVITSLALTALVRSGAITRIPW